MPPRPARRTLALAALALLGLVAPGCSNSAPEVDNAVVTPDASVKPPPEPSPVQPSPTPETAGAASAPAPKSDAPKP